MAFELAVGTAFVASLSVTGLDPAGASKAVAMLDYSSVKSAADPRLCPIFQPDVTAQVQAQRVERNSFGNGVTARQTLVWAVPYVLLYQPTGTDDRGLAKVLPNLIATLKAICTAILNNDKPTDPMIDMYVSSLAFGQTVSDPAGQMYHGARVILAMMEFIN